MPHMFFIEDTHLKNLYKLSMNKIDGQWFCLQDSPNYVDIAQYSSKYQNIRIVTVPKSNLDYTKMLPTW